MKARAVLVLVSGKPREGGHPLAGEREVGMIAAPTLGEPFVFLGGQTSPVMSGTFAFPDGPEGAAVWDFTTFSGSTYRLTLSIDKGDGVLAGGPVGHA